MIGQQHIINENDRAAEIASLKDCITTIIMEVNGEFWSAVFDAINIHGLAKKYNLSLEELFIILEEVGKEVTVLKQERATYDNATMEAKTYEEFCTTCCIKDIKKVKHEHIVVKLSSKKNENN